MGLTAVLLLDNSPPMLQNRSRQLAEIVHPLKPC
jgi:hypothetical protein